MHTIPRFYVGRMRSMFLCNNYPSLFASNDYRVRCTSRVMGPRNLGSNSSFNTKLWTLFLDSRSITTPFPNISNYNELKINGGQKYMTCCTLCVGLELQWLVNDHNIDVMFPNSRQFRLCEKTILDSMLLFLNIWYYGNQKCVGQEKLHWQKLSWYVKIIVVLINKRYILKISLWNY